MSLPSKKRFKHISIEAVESLFSGRVIAFRPELARIGLYSKLGRLGARAGLMLSQSLWLTKERADENGWFTCTMEEWFELTGLSDEEQSTARQTMIKHGLWEEKREGVVYILHGRERRGQGQLHYKVSLYAIAEALNALVENDPRGDATSRKPAPKAALKTTSESSPKRTTRKDDSGKTGIIKTTPVSPESRFRGNRNHDSEIDGLVVPANPEFPSSIRDNKDTSSISFDKKLKSNAVDDEISHEINLQSSAASAPTGESQSPVNSLLTQLLTFAQRHEIALAESEAQEIAASWPAAHLEDDELFTALTADYEKYHLDTPVENIRRHPKLKSVSAARLRWFLCVWSAFPESNGEGIGASTKTACFLNKVATSEPSKSWLERELAERRKQAVEAVEAQANAERQAFFNSLNKEQKDALTNDTIAELEEKRRGMFFNANSPEVKALRLYNLRNPETREWLMGLDINAKATDSIEDEEEYTPPPHQLRFEAFISTLLTDINAGRMTVEQIAKYLPDYLEPDEVEEIKTSVVERLKAA